MDESVKSLYELQQGTLGELRKRIKNDNDPFTSWVKGKIEKYFSTTDYSDKIEAQAFMFLMAIILGKTTPAKNSPDYINDRGEYEYDKNIPSLYFYINMILNKIGDSLGSSPDIWNHMIQNFTGKQFWAGMHSDSSSHINSKLADKANEEITIEDLYNTLVDDKNDNATKLTYKIREDLFDSTYVKNIEKVKCECENLMKFLGIINKEPVMSSDNVTSIVENNIKMYNQVIFTGAPGTGKTYSVREHVKKSGEERYKFVQFHPSYDYTDFIEGLRPVKIGGSNEPTFARIDGVFKKFCRKIVENNLMKIFDKSSNELCESMIEIVFTILKKANDEKKDTQSEFKKLVDDELKEIIAKLKENLTVTKNNPNDTGYSSHNLNNESEGNFNNNERENLDIEFLISINDVYEEKIKANLKSLFAKYMKDDNNNIDTGNNETAENNEISQEVNENKNQDIDWYYFVVDEVNRADLSKVFGEIMFGLEESYRGIENRFNTQYMNLNTFIVDEKDGKADVMTFDCFKNGFFIPRNLKFIGTMNDIDRSVESFDFALRRRFHWVDIKAKDVMESSLSSILKEKIDINKISDLTKRIISMNEVISGDTGKKLGLSEAYHIGPAYFKNYSDNVDNGVYFDQNLESILREYVRGRRTNDIDDFIKKCRQSFIDYKKVVAGIEQNNDYMDNAGQTLNGATTDNSSENANQTN